MDISFTSKLIPVKYNDFNKITASISDEGFVDFPWNINSSRVAQNVYTNHVCDCTAYMINDGKKALLMHLMPYNDANHNIYRIFDFISNHFKLPDKNLQAVLVGSHAEEISQDIFKKIALFSERFEIPTTILKTGKSPTHLAYKTSKDEIIVSNDQIDVFVKAGRSNKEAIYNGFEYVKISERDEI